MSDIINPLFGTRDEEDPFLSPSGQPDSLVDALANTQRPPTTTHISVEAEKVVLIIIEVR